MTLDEKLDRFYTAAIDSATSQNIQIVNEYKQSLQKIYDDHKEDALRKAEVTYHVESNNLIREKNRNLSVETIKIKRRISEKSDELTDLLFQDVAKKIDVFMKTSEYFDMLAAQITAAKDFARGEEITIYINPSDEALKVSLESKTEATLTISVNDFIGGTRAVIHSKSILIDNSFLTKYAEAKDAFML